MAPAAVAGYSGRTLAQKLGLEGASVLLALDAPAHYGALLGPLPALRLADGLAADVDVEHVFVTAYADLAARLATLRTRLRPDAAVWVSWPKKAARVPTDLTEDAVRAVALPLGYVDVKVCAVDAVWSGLKLVVRKALR